MAHPDLAGRGAAGEQVAGDTEEVQLREPVFALVAFAHAAAQQMRHQLLAVADAEHGMAVAQNGRVNGRAGGIVNAGRSAGDDQTARGSEFRSGCVATPDVRIDAQFPHLAGNANQQYCPLASRMVICASVSAKS